MPVVMAQVRGMRRVAAPSHTACGVQLSAQLDATSADCVKMITLARDRYAPARCAAPSRDAALAVACLSSATPPSGAPCR